jgi:hypothetical protein
MLQLTTKIPIKEEPTLSNFASFDIQVFEFMEITLPKLNYPISKFKLKQENGKMFIFDDSRKKYVSLTPEEWVRQNCMHYLRDQKGFPISLLAVEKGFSLNGVTLRYDLVAYSTLAKPLLLVECKAPGVDISQKTFDQIAVYNLELNVPYLLVTNGLAHFCCVADFENKNFRFLKELPNFKEIILTR